MLYILGINRIKKTFAERKIVNGIKQIGLANPVISNKTVDLAAEIVFQLGKILEVNKGQRFEMHIQYT